MFPSPGLTQDQKKKKKNRNKKPKPKKKPQPTCFKPRKLSLPTELFQVASNEARQEEQGDWEI